MSIVEAVRLKRSFGDFLAVAGIDFSIDSGSCYGLLGPNGAGKTTTVKMIQGFLPRSSGSLMVMGRDIESKPAKTKSQIGVVPQENNLDRDLTVLQNLLTYARYFDISPNEAVSRAEELLRFLELDGKWEAQITALSGGMQRRLAIARSLINRPRLLILDEPTTGLDPEARHLIWRRIQTLKQQGVTIILTTHYMEEAERLCDFVAMMNNGTILMEGKPADLIEKEVGKEVIEATISKTEIEKFSLEMERMNIKQEQRGETVYLYPNKTGSENVLQKVMEYRHSSLIHRKASLEDIFLKLAGRKLDE